MIVFARYDPLEAADGLFQWDEDAGRALAEAAARDWLVVSMATDFARVFPGDPE